MSDTTASGRPHLGWPTKSLYGLSGLGAALRNLPLLLFYNQLIGLPAVMVSAAILIGLLVDAFWDPIVGQLSDTTRSRLGRRHPYLYAAIAPAALCYVAIYLPPRGWSHEALFLYLVVFIVAARMFESLVEIPNAALLPELSRDYDQRTSLSGWRFIFSTAAGPPLATLLAYGVFLKGTKAQPFGQLNAAGYAPYAVTVALISVVVIVVSALATQRFAPYMYRPQRRRPTFGEMARQLGQAISNRSFAALAIAILISGFAAGLSAGLGAYINTYFWELPSRSLLPLGLAVAPFVLLGVVAAPYVSRRLGKKRACLSAMYLLVFASTLPMGLRLLGLMPPNSSPWVLRILILDRVVEAFVGALAAVCLTSMLADVVEDVQVKTKQRSEGVLFAADALVRKLTMSFATLLPGLILTFVRFPTHARPGHVDPAILNHMALIYLPLFTSLALCAGSMIWFYRIDRRQHEDNLAHLNQAAALAAESDLAMDPHAGEIIGDIATSPAS